MQTITTLTHWLQQVSQFLPLAGVLLISVCLLSVFIILVLRIADRLWLRKQRMVLLELTPPATIDKTPIATQRLFSVLSGMETTRPWLHKVLKRSIAFSAEVTGNRAQGIRFIIRVPENDVHTFEQNMTSFLPNVRCRQIDDYLPADFSQCAVRVLDFKQTGYFAYPLQTQGELEDHDFMAYLTNTMANLASGALISFQVVLAPVKMREADALAGRLMHNQELVYSLSKRRAPIAKFLLNGIGAVLFSILDGIGDITSGGTGRMVSQRDYYRRHEVNIKTRPARILSASEQELAAAVQTKLSQPLFRASIRALVVMDKAVEAKQRAKSIKEALAVFSVPKYQSLQARYTFPRVLQTKRRLSLFMKRLPSLWHSSSVILSVGEVADLYHFPHSHTTRTDNITKSLSKTLAASTALKNASFDVIIGRNHHHGTTTDIGLTPAERERHVFMVGATGSGKTTLMKYSIIQDMKNGKGVAVIDPHGDLAQELLAHVPEERLDDVIYLNPDDTEYPIGLNLLEIPEGLTGDRLIKAKDFVTETVVSIMRKTFSEGGSGGFRVESVLRNAIMTALTAKEPTLFTIYDLLMDKDFRKSIVDKLEIDWLKKFWRNEFNKAGDYQQVKMMDSVISKIGRYRISPSTERMFSQAKSTIDFNEILDGKILICNLAKGAIGEDTSTVLGIAILAKLQLAAYQRVKQKRADRKPFFAYVDEFQNFATRPFAEMLSESRKYKLFLIMAEQTTEQQDDEKMLNTILTNSNTKICFRTDSLKDEQRMLHLFRPHVEPGEIANLPAYSFYAKLSGGNEPQEPVSGMTIVCDGGDENIVERVIEASRKNYAKKFVVKKLRKKRQLKSEKKTEASDENKSADQDDTAKGSEDVN